MHPSGSMLLTLIERIRAYLDVPVVTAKYDNNYMLRHVIVPAMVDVWSRISNTADNPVLIRFPISLVQDQEFYQLPPCIGMVHRIVVRDEGGDVLRDFVPRGEMHPSGPGWAIEGNLLALRPFPLGGMDVDIIYAHSGDVMPHYATDGELNADLTALLLDYQPELGDVDRRPNAYAGQVLRLLPASPGTIEERVIASHDPVAREVVVRRPFVVATGATSATTTEPEALAYEIVPAGLQHLTEAIAAWGALKMGTGLRIPQTQAAQIMLQYRSALKTCYDNFANIQGRTSDHFQKAHVDSELFWRL